MGLDLESLKQQLPNDGITLKTAGISPEEIERTRTQTEQIDKLIDEARDGIRQYDYSRAKLLLERIEWDHGSHLNTVQRFRVISNHRFAALGLAKPGEAASSTTAKIWSTRFCNSNKLQPRRKSMQLPLSQQGQQSASNATGATSGGFIETVEYDRLLFCDACRRFRYISLCYGPPGVGKTLSAFHYSRSEMIVSFDRWTSQSRDQLPINTILYTTAVINTPSKTSVLQISHPY
jgi:hypothetical protein